MYKWIIILKSKYYNTIIIIIIIELLVVLFYLTMNKGVGQDYKYNLLSVLNPLSSPFWQTCE